MLNFFITALSVFVTEKHFDNKQEPISIHFPYKHNNLFQSLMYPKWILSKEKNLTVN